MRIEIEGERLFFDVAGQKLVPDGPSMAERPTAILLHGGPGFDHSHYKPQFDELADLPCSCAVCRSHTAEQLRTAKDRTRLLALHNLAVTLAEIARIRQAITDGTLWELVDERCRNHPQLLSGYRRLLQHNAELEEFDRAHKRRFFDRGDESCARTEVLRYQRMITRLRLG